MIDGIPDQVNERIVELLDHGLVEFGLLAFRHQLDLLAEIAGEVVHDAPEAPEKRADRHHPDAHRRIAQLKHQPFDLLGNGPDLLIRACSGDLAQARLRDDQLADAVHQLVETLGRHPDAGADSFRAFPATALGFFSAPKAAGLQVPPAYPQHRKAYLPAARPGQPAGDAVSRPAAGSALRVTAGLHRLDLKLHLVADEDEHVLYGLPRLRRCQENLPFDVAGCGIEFLKRRNARLSAA